MSQSKIYIVAMKSDWSGPVQKVVDEIYFGPFPDNEENRINDPYGDNLEADGFEVYSIAMSDEDATKIKYINPREFWISQLETLTYIQEPQSDQEDHYV